MNCLVDCAFWTNVEIVSARLSLTSELSMHDTEEGSDDVSSDGLVFRIVIGPECSF